MPAVSRLEKVFLGERAWFCVLKNCLIMPRRQSCSWGRGALGCRLMLGGTLTALGGCELPAQCCLSQIWLPKCPPGME